jgi:outer membrane protein
MKTIQTNLLIAGFLILFTGFTGQAQIKAWKLEDCINYALSKNIQIQKAILSVNQSQLASDQARNNRLPNLSASVSQNFNWSKNNNISNGGSGASGANSTNYSLSSNITLFNGAKLSTKMKQAEIDLQNGQFYTEAVKESVGLSILNAYLQVLYANESVSNAQKQIEATTEQLDLAKEQMNTGLKSMSDYLTIKSELATEKSTLATSQSQRSIAKVTLMQLMELPVDPNFEISSPNLDSLLIKTEKPDAQFIYNTALGFKPEIKNAELTKESVMLNVKIAKADLMPSIQMGAGLTSGYSSLTTGADYTGQLKDKVSPSVGLSLAVPIFQKKQIKTNVSIANIAVSNAELDELNTKNTLRKEIEQACLDVETAKSVYVAGLDQMQSSQESYNVTDEKYKQGLLNSVDFQVQKTSLIAAESKLLQAKYSLIFSYKVLDFYKGIPLVL